MGFYNDRVLPLIIDKVCSTPEMNLQRATIVPKASGEVLELGVGTGLNLAHYDRRRVATVTGIDPCRTSVAMAARRAGDIGLPFEAIVGSAQELPFADGRFDTVVSTYSLCTIPDPALALAEARRVLKPGGTLLYCEHVLSPQAGIGRWQNRLNRVWGCCFGGCNINRDVDRMICDAGFATEEATRSDFPGHMVLIRHQSLGRALKAA